MSTVVKSGLHPRNRHRDRYDFAALVARVPELARFLRPSPHGDQTIDYADPAAVLALNRALLLTHYGLADWFLPPGYLCPPIPGRADYLHHAADLLAGDGPRREPPRGPSVVALDLGTGANLIYPILGRAEYGWRFVGSDIDPVALQNAARLVAANPSLAGGIELRRQPDRTALLRGIIRPGERYDLTLCNPPFHASAADAEAGTARKVRNLGTARADRPTLNFAGRPTELWCPGGEARFIARLIAESADYRTQVRWFTTLVSSRDTLPRLRRALDAVRPTEVRTIQMAQGQKRSRLLAWTFVACAEGTSVRVAAGKKPASIRRPRMATNRHE
ncbi:MAG TPA: 23S rRNA (adenine(1618)-N(6))-methyltransferase RlmF [Opitutaceae bacterium]|jgi:23S rRNA (adenine1618-N6)-methyltransferase|nr:23S rRNA (adenine(1618)-N(6))-methyltransferase RlmF [Opitutaceae bacterium]HOG93896.1 23S rRNA (adenine(1618)-N(6))-methyltransferase RlmF [Opitutaceae bacterium]HOR26055.1 23S rRNA (adenine(1618)-N(6))-methyltransferase RlmF [Opitutaceae bacterium]